MVQTILLQTYSERNSWWQSSNPSVLYRPASTAPTFCRQSPKFDGGYLILEANIVMSTICKYQSREKKKKRNYTRIKLLVAGGAEWIMFKDTNLSKNVNEDGNEQTPISGALLFKIAFEYNVDWFAKVSVNDEECLVP